MKRFEGLAANVGSKTMETREWEPEEYKEWPAYIQQRFDALNAANDLDLDKLHDLFLQNESLNSPELLLYLSTKYKEKDEKDPRSAQIIQEMIEPLTLKKDHKIRLIAATALGNLGEAGLNDLIHLSKDEVPPVRTAAILSLGQIGQPALNALRDLSTDKYYNTRAATACALGNLENPPLDILKQLAYDRDMKVSREAILALGKVGEPALEMLSQMADKAAEEDGHEIAMALGQIGQKALPAIQRLAKNDNWYNRQVAAEALGYIGKPALQDLIALSKDEDSDVCKEALKSLGKTGAAAKDTLEAFVLDPNLRIEREAVKAAIESMGDIGTVCLETLKFLAQDEKENFEIRTTAIESLGKVGEPALTLLQSLAKESSWLIQKPAITALANTGPNALETLKELAKDNNPLIQKFVLESIAKIKVNSLSQAERQQMIKSFVVRQEPILANPLVEDLYDPQNEGESIILKLHDIVAALQKQHPGLIGLSVLGSFSKGYWLKTRDFDWGLIFNGEPNEEEGLFKEFSEEAIDAGLDLCANHSLNVSAILPDDPSRLEIPFNGLFIGNRQGLKTARDKIINAVDQEQWHKIQEEWSKALENYSKMINRFDLTPDEASQIKSWRTYLWSLPDYETAKREYSVE